MSHSLRSGSPNPVPGDRNGFRRPGTREDPLTAPDAGERVFNSPTTGLASAGVPGDDLRERVLVLRDAAALAAAAAVAVGGPEPEAGPAVARGVAADGVEVAHRDRLARVVGLAVHRGEAAVPVGGVVVPAERGLELVLEPVDRGLRQRGHVAAAGEVERHDRPDVHTRADRLGLVDQALAARIGAGGRGAHGDDYLQVRVLLLGQLARVEDAVLHRVVLELVGVLDVEVDRLEAVGVDHLLVRARQGRRRGAL